MEVPPELAGARADRAAALLFDGFSRAVLTRWMRQGLLTLDGRAVDPDKRLLGGERLALAPGEQRAATTRPAQDWAIAQEVAFAVVHEDDDCLVVDKPAGVAVHPGAGNPDGTLVNGLLKYRPALGKLPRAGVVHRIDMDTSGLLIVAASLAGQRGLAAAIGRHDILRRYLCVAEGEIIAGSTIDKPIGRDPASPISTALGKELCHK